MSRDECFDACSGKDHRMGEHFHGQLAGLSILVNATETDQVLHCLHSCQEKLDFTRLDDMEAGTVTKAQVLLGR